MTADHVTRPLRLKLDPVGISRAAHGLFWVGFCFCTGVAVIGTAMLVFPHVGSTVKGVYHRPSGQALPWPAWAVMGTFAAVSVGVAVAGLNMGVRREIVEVRDGALSIEQTDLFRTRQLKWPASKVVAIDARATGLSVGGTKQRGGVSRSGVHGRTIDALYVDSADGRSVRLLTGRDGAELDAVAAGLRDAIGCGSVAS